MKARSLVVTTLILGAVATYAHADGEQPGTTTPTPFFLTLDVLPDWRLVTWDEDFAAFISLKRARRERDVVTVWERWEHRQTLGSINSKSSRIRREYDCNLGRSRPTSETSFEKNNLSGKNVFSAVMGKNDWPWDEVAPGTYAEIVMEWACEHVLPEKK